MITSKVWCVHKLNRFEPPNDKSYASSLLLRFDQECKLRALCQGNPSRSRCKSSEGNPHCILHCTQPMGCRILRFRFRSPPFLSVPTLLLTISKTTAECLHEAFLPLRKSRCVSASQTHWCTLCTVARIANTACSSFRLHFYRRLSNTYRILRRKSSGLFGSRACPRKTCSGHRPIQRNQTYCSTSLSCWFGSFPQVRLQYFPSSYTLLHCVEELLSSPLTKFVCHRAEYLNAVARY